MVTEDIKLSPRADVSKCEGIGCAFKTGCGRFLRPSAQHQTWSSFYAINSDDCSYFEIVNHIHGVAHDY
jgi:hypothetical protein